MEILAIELDFAIFEFQHEIPMENTQEIRRATESGVYITSTTGRFSNQMIR